MTSDSIRLTGRAIHPRRVAITGLGAISSLGSSANATWKAVLAGNCGIRVQPDWDPETYPCVVHGNVPEQFLCNRFLDGKVARNTARFARMAVEAAGGALIDAGLVTSDSFEPTQDLSHGAVHLGTCVGGTYDELLPAYPKFLDRGPRHVSPHLHVMHPHNMAAYTIHSRFGMRGSSSTVVTACATGSQAIGQAFLDIRYGRSPFAVAGAVESDYDPYFLAAFTAMKALCTDSNDRPEHASRPFDATRAGFVLGEGAAMLVLEDLEHAIARDAPIYAELCGFATSNDAYHPIAPRPDGAVAAEAILRAIEDADLEPTDIGHINAHAAATPAGDLAEAEAIRAVFGDRAGEIPVTSNKGALGHCMAASGAMESMLSVFSLATQTIPPTLKFTHPDPAIALDVVHGAPRVAEFAYLTKHSFGLGGQNACVVIGKAPVNARTVTAPLN